MTNLESPGSMILFLCLRPESIQDVNMRWGNVTSRVGEGGAGGGT